MVLSVEGICHQQSRRWSAPLSGGPSEKTSGVFSWERGDVYPELAWNLILYTFLSTLLIIVVLPSPPTCPRGTKAVHEV